MSMKSQLTEDMKTAMKAGDKPRVAALRLIAAKIKDRDIELRTGTAPVDDDQLVVDVLQKMAKQRRESIVLFQQGGRAELAADGRNRTIGEPEPVTSRSPAMSSSAWPVPSVFGRLSSTNSEFSGTPDRPSAWVIF